jgi:hypothetical protein
MGEVTAANYQQAAQQRAAAVSGVGNHHRHGHRADRCRKGLSAAQGRQR